MTLDSSAGEAPGGDGRVFIWGSGIEIKEDIRRLFAVRGVEGLARRPDLDLDLTGADIEVYAKRLGYEYSNVEAFYVGRTAADLGNFNSLIDRIVTNEVPNLTHLVVVYDGALEQLSSTAWFRKLQAAGRITILSRSFFENLLRSKSSYQTTSGTFTVIDLAVNYSSLPQATFIDDIGMFIPKELASTVYLDGALPEIYWYWDEIGAAGWLRLNRVRDKTKSSQYAFAERTYGLLEDHIDDLLRELKARFSQVAEYIPPIDLVAIGLGAAQKEVLLLGRIAGMYDEQGLPEELYYAPVDVSFPLLENAIRTVITSDDPNLKELNQGPLIIKPILTNVLALDQELFQFGNPKKLYVALGMLGNFPTGEFLDSLNRAMDRDNSYLLVDAEFTAGREPSTISDPYSGEEARAFVYHPLDLLVRASSSRAKFEVKDKYSSTKIGYTIFGRYSGGTKRVKAETVHGDAFEGWATKKGLDPARLSHYFDPAEVTDSVTVVMYYDGGDSVKPLVLGYSTKFHMERLKKFIEEHHFTIVRSFPSPDGQFGSFLLAKN